MGGLSQAHRCWMRLPHNPGIGMHDPVIRNLGSSLSPAFELRPASGFRQQTARLRSVGRRLTNSARSD
jgi:hypothetical protein